MENQKRESDKFVVNVECAIYQGDKWLMIVRSLKEGHAGGTLSMAGGTVEYVDTSDQILEHALRRELLEEIGVEVGAFTYIESKSFVTKKGNTVLDIVFAAPYVSGTPTAMSKDEVESVSWMTLVEIESHPKAPVWTLQSMRLAQKKIHG